MDEPIQTFESPPLAPSAPTSPPPPPDDHEAEVQELNGQEQRRGLGPLPQNPNCNSDSNPSPPRNPEFVNLEAQNALPPNSPELSEPATSLIDANKPEEREEADEDKMVVDEHEIQEVEDPEPMTVARSPAPAAAKGNSSRRGGVPKGKKGFNRYKKDAMEKNLPILMQNFKVIPFEPRQSPELSKHEELLKRAGLWDFAHIEFDRNLREDLIGQLIVNYTSSKRCTYVEGHRIRVNRADLARALHLNIKKHGEAKGGDGTQETTWPEEFLSFVLDFVSNWMLLHGDMWVVPDDIQSWTENIKEGHLEKVDWASLIWFMVEKELSQGTSLKECYYASYLQRLIKAQKEEIFMEEPEGVQEVLTVKDDDDECDVKMEDPSHEDPHLNQLTTQLSLGPHVVTIDSLTAVRHDMGDVNVGGDGNFCDDDARGANGNAGVVFNARNTNAGGIDNVEASLASGDGCMAKMMADMEHIDHEASDVRNVEGTDHDAVAVRNVEGTHLADGDVGNVGVIDHVEDIDTIQEEEERGPDAMNLEQPRVDEPYHVEGIDAVQAEEERGPDAMISEQPRVDEPNHVEGDDAVQEEEERGTDAMDLEQPRVDEQNHWFSSEKSNGDEHFLQSCSGLMDVAYEQADRVNDVEDDDSDGDEHAEEGFETLQKCDGFNGISLGNFMQPLEPSHMAFTSSDVGSQPSLDLLSARVENHQVMLGAPSMLKIGNKRSIEHGPDHDLVNSHVTADDRNKRIRTDAPWDPKGVPDFESCIEQVHEWLGKASLAHATTTERSLNQASINQDILLNELASKDRLIHSLRSSLEEVHKRRQAEEIRFDNELSVMGTLIDGYRRALKDTQKAFCEYRKRVCVAEEPLYKDAGEGGVVKSVVELERERLAREEEERMAHIAIVGWVKRMENEWYGIFRRHLLEIEMLGGKLLNLVHEVGILRDRFLMRKASETVREGGSRKKPDSSKENTGGEASFDEKITSEAAHDEEMADEASCDAITGVVLAGSEEITGGEAVCDEKIHCDDKTHCDLKTGGEAASDEKAGDEIDFEEKTGCAADCDEITGGGETVSDEKPGCEADCDEKSCGEADFEEKIGGEADFEEKIGGEADFEEKTGGEAASDEKTVVEAASDEKIVVETGSDEKTVGEAASDEKTAVEALSDGKTPGDAA